jgi:superkiller protein 3
MGRVEEAIEAFHKAIELDPQYPYAWSNLGDRYVELGRLEEAGAAFQERIRLSADDALSGEVSLGVIVCHRGDVCAARSHWKRALAIWEQARQSGLYSPAALMHERATALLGLGQREEALDALREALAQRRPGERFDLGVYELLAAASEPRDGIEEMIALVRSAVEEEPE